MTVDLGLSHGDPTPFEPILDNAECYRFDTSLLTDCSTIDISMNPDYSFDVLITDPALQD